MIRGTTPTHVFGVPFQAAEIAALQVIYAQGGRAVLTRTKPNCTVTDGEISLTLTEAETFRFEAGTPVQLQLRIKTVTGEIFATRIHTVALTDALSEVTLS